MGKVEQELELRQEISAAEQIANAILVTNDNEFEYATGQIKKVKSAVKMVEEYWEPMRVSAYDSYQSVLEHKKDMVDPLKKAEKIIKDKISRYLQEKEAERKRKEEEMRRIAQMEAEKKLAEAEAMEQAGDTESAEIAIEEAEILENISMEAVAYSNPVSVKGVSKTKAWKITSVNEAEVPVNVAGMIIRPVDEKAVMRLIKASGGTVTIPGIKYEETVNIRVRA